jgi:hypothetical protein
MSRRARLSVCLAGVLGIVACSSRSVETEQLDASDQLDATAKQDAGARQDAGTKQDGTAESGDAARAGPPFECGSSTCHAGTEFCNKNVFTEYCTGGGGEAGIDPATYDCEPIPDNCISPSNTLRDTCICIADTYGADDGGMGDAGANVIVTGDGCTVVPGGFCG